MWNSIKKRSWLTAALVLLVFSSVPPAWSEDSLSLNMKNVSIEEVMELLSRKARANIVLSNGVSGDVSVNLYDMQLDQAIRAIADAGGYAVETRQGSYFIVNREEAGKYSQSGLTIVRSFEVSYIDAQMAADVIAPLLSNYGQITAVPERRLLIVRDQPEFIGNVGQMLQVLDRKPRQILIEAKILELTLDDTQSYGFDWSKFFSNQDGNGSFGTRGLSSPGSPGAFFSLTEDKLTLALDALRSRGHVRTLSAPRLLALENQEASVVIGDRQGFRVTTTINQITTESIEFLESGVILRVTPTIDATGKIMLDIHPEVSTGTISDGIPSQTTTEVTTRLLIPDSHSVFIGGLIKNSVSKSTSGVPVLGSVPIVRRLFSNDSSVSLNTETIVVITPRLIEAGDSLWQLDATEKVRSNEELLEQNLRRNRSELERLLPVVELPSTVSETSVAQLPDFVVNPVAAAAAEKTTAAFAPVESLPQPPVPKPVATLAASDPEKHLPPAEPQPQPEPATTATETAPVTLASRWPEIKPDRR